MDKYLCQLRTENRLKLDDCFPDMVMSLAEGNPGATVVLLRVIQEGSTIDPDAISSALALFDFDAMGIYGSNIWILYKDVCGENLVRVFALLRARQLGLLPETAIKKAVEHGSIIIDLDCLIESVQAKLPNFGRMQKGEQNGNT